MIRFLFSLLCPAWSTPLPPHCLARTLLTSIAGETPSTTMPKTPGARKSRRFLPVPRAAFSHQHLFSNRLTQSVHASASRRNKPTHTSAHLWPRRMFACILVQDSTKTSLHPERGSTFVSRALLLLSPHILRCPLAWAQPWPHLSTAPVALATSYFASATVRDSRCPQRFHIYRYSSTYTYLFPWRPHPTSGSTLALCAPCSRVPPGTPKTILSPEP